jgi:hypothetical protein
MSIHSSTRPVSIEDLHKVATTAMDAMANLYHLIITRGDADMVAVADKVLADRQIKLMPIDDAVAALHPQPKGKYDA